MISMILHTQRRQQLCNKSDRAAVAISNAVSLPETAAKGAQDKNAFVGSLDDYG